MANRSDILGTFGPVAARSRAQPATKKRVDYKETKERSTLHIYDGQWIYRF